MKTIIKSSDSGLFRHHKAHSPEEILAAGGATAFGRKSEKNNKSIIKILEESPQAEPFDDKEWNDQLRQLNNSK